MNLVLSPDNLSSSSNLDPAPTTITSEVLRSLPGIYRRLAEVLIEKGEWLLVDSEAAE